ncbi:MAG: M20/M25/M40 family metallo-hydrolase [Bacteroidales bacterium]|nr:M20/M25/M40 family metallo-hydrolase [Bacteroidales bacterium]
MDLGFFRELLSIDSTSGKERKVAEWLAERLPGMFPAANRPALRAEEVGDGTLNLLLTWGTPRIVFCSHLDTVPPYIEPIFPEGVFLSEPSLRDTVIKGRGSCDAKGQIFAIVEACKRLAEEGKTDFGMLLLAGEETGSWGAKAFAKTDFSAEYLVVGEPTDNCMVSASKGTKSFDLKFTGEPFHSGYPQYGVSAVDLFVAFVNALKAKDFGIDPELGETTWNIGLVHSDNPQNILSPELTCRIYFRTTFVSDDAVQQWMADTPALIPGLTSSVIPGLTGNLAVTARGGDTPARYWTVDGLPSKSAAFGSDAPHLKNFTHKAICGPGSITVAHRDDEHVTVADLATAVNQYLALYRSVME